MNRLKKWLVNRKNHVLFEGGGSVLTPKLLEISFLGRDFQNLAKNQNYRNPQTNLATI
jgi:hypothetical protein